MLKGTVDTLDNIVDRIKLKKKTNRPFRSLSPSSLETNSTLYSECLIVKKPEILVRRDKNKSLSPLKQTELSDYEGLLVKKTAKKFLKKFKEMYTFVVE